MKFGGCRWSLNRVEPLRLPGFDIAPEGSVILALDPGTANLGWAVVAPRTGAVLELGVVAQKPDPDLAKSTDRSARVHVQAVLYREFAGRHRITAIAAEAAGFNPRPLHHGGRAVHVDRRAGRLRRGGRRRAVRVAAEALAARRARPRAGRSEQGRLRRRRSTSSGRTAARRSSSRRSRHASVTTRETPSASACSQRFAPSRRRASVDRDEERPTTFHLETDPEEVRAKPDVASVERVSGRLAGMHASTMLRARPRCTNSLGSKTVDRGGRLCRCGAIMTIAMKAPRKPSLLHRLFSRKRWRIVQLITGVHRVHHPRWSMGWRSSSRRGAGSRPSKGRTTCEVTPSRPSRPAGSATTAPATTTAPRRGATDARRGTRDARAAPHGRRRAGQGRRHGLACQRSRGAHVQTRAAPRRVVGNGSGP